MHSGINTMTNEPFPATIADIRIPPGFTVFCDLDGTLVDTDYANYLSYRRAVREVTFGAHDVEHTGERLNRETLKKRIPSLNDAEVEVIATLKGEYFSDFLTETRLNTALINLFRKHRDTNAIALVTCCRENRVVQVLRHHNIHDFFSRLICWETIPADGSLNKYEIAIRLMGARREAVLVFENENASAEQAASAGVPRSNIYKVYHAAGEQS
jgi:beta-phosphoglucomutase